MIHQISGSSHFLFVEIPFIPSFRLVEFHDSSNFCFVEVLVCQIFGSLSGLGAGWVRLCKVRLAINGSAKNGDSTNQKFGKNGDS